MKLPQQVRLASVFVAATIVAPFIFAQSLPIPSPSGPRNTNQGSPLRGAKQKRLGAANAGINTPPSTRPRTSVTRTSDEVQFARTHGLSGWEYVDAYLYWLRQRAYPYDRIEPSTYKAGIQHKFGMPLQFVPEAAVHRWEFVGPRNLPTPYRQYFGQGVTSGRVNGVAFDPIDQNIVYVATAGGGLWKIDRKSKKWTSLSDDWTDSKVSSIAVSASNGNETLYVGTGDFDGGRSIYGFGIMKSTTGGASWSNLLNQELSGYSVKHIVVYPDNPQVVIVTAGNNLVDLGAVWRSADAGATWQKVPLDSADWEDVECGAKGDQGKRECYAVGAGIGGEIWRSEDIGQTWSRLSPPISWNYQQSFAVAPSARDPLTVYILAGTDRTIWKSVDAGNTWNDITNDFPAGNGNYNWGQSDYDYFIACTTRAGTQQDVLYSGLIDIVASLDGGSHWTSVGNTYEGTAVTHNDQHAFAVNPQNPNEMLLGNDGGVYLLTFDPGAGHWTFDSSLNENLEITQFYKADFSPTDPTYMLGGAQDNATPLSSGDLKKWNNVGGGDGGFTAINPVDPKIQYATSQYLTIYRTKDNWKDWDPNHPEKSEITYYDRTGGNSRAWLGDTAVFVAPIALDTKDPKLLYAATNFLWRWDETASTWTDHLGGQMLSSGVDDAVTTIAIAPTDNKRIYTGSQTGQIWMTSDAGQTWTRIDDGLPKFWITSIAVHPSDPDTIIVGLSGTGDANTGHPGHLWKCVHTSLENRSWLNVGGRFRTALPNVPVDSVVIDSADSSRIYVGTDIGFFLTNDGGVTWADGTRTLGLPNVQVNDLRMVSGTGYLMAATFGRGMWRIALPVPSAASLPHFGSPGKKKPPQRKKPAS
jgi:photosystem II stability/assembly factor-like uncharacterized protein